jgi:dolichol kinase
MLSKVLAQRDELHLLRKAWHILTGIGALSLYYVFEVPLKDLRWLALAVAIVAFSVDFIRINYSEFNTRVLKVLSPVMRDSEENSFSGFPFYALGIALSLFFYDERIAVLSIIFLVFADPIASIIGVSYGKDKILPNKSLQGTIAAFVTCAAITFLYIWEFKIDGFTLISFTICAAIIGSISELFSAFNIDDNLTIPVISGGGITLLNLIFHIF